MSPCPRAAVRARPLRGRGGRARRGPPPAALLLRLPPRAEGRRRTLDGVDPGHLAHPGAARRAPDAARRGLGQRPRAPRPPGARHARGRGRARSPPAGARVADPGGHRRHAARGPRRHGALPLPARPHARHLRRRPGQAEGQDHPPRAPRLRGRLRRGDGCGGARAGPASLRRPGRARPRRGRRRAHPRRGPPGARLMAYRVLLTDALGPEGLARLREQPELEIEARPGLSPAELRDAVRDFHALIIRSGTKVTADVLAPADALRVIGRAGIGVANVDVAPATKKGIVVMNTPGGSNVTTAEHAITLDRKSTRLN